MSAGAVRAVVIAVCVAGIAGMIAGSIADNNAVAMTFGLVAAVAALCLIVATAVARSALGAASAGPVDPEAAGQEVEDRVADLVAAGADEQAVRDLVHAAVAFGRESGRIGR